MREDLRVADVRLVPANAEDQRTGLVGFVSATLNGRLRLGGLALRRTAAGRCRLSFPVRDDGAGRRWALVRPIDDAARRDIEKQVFAAIGLEDLEA